MLKKYIDILEEHLKKEFDIIIKYDKKTKNVKIMVYKPKKIKLEE